MAACMSARSAPRPPWVTTCSLMLPVSDVNIVHEWSVSIAHQDQVVSMLIDLCFEDLLIWPGTVINNLFTEPITEILGGPNIFLEEGNNLNLTCVVRDSPEPPQYIFWYRNSQVWQYENYDIYLVRGNHFDWGCFFNCNQSLFNGSTFKNF